MSIKIPDKDERAALVAAMEGAFTAYRLLGKTDREYAELVVGMLTSIVESVTEELAESA